MPDHTLKAAIGAVFLTLLFFFLIAFQPMPADEAFSMGDATAAPLTEASPSITPLLPNPLH